MANRKSFTAKLDESRPIAEPSGTSDTAFYHSLHLEFAIARCFLCHNSLRIAPEFLAHLLRLQV